jgi:hypothetical protein
MRQYILEELDSGLTDSRSRSSPRLRFRHTLERDGPDPAQEQQLGGLANFMKQGMPQMHGMGRLFFQKHPYGDGHPEWPVSAVLLMSGRILCA